MIFIVDKDFDVGKAIEESWKITNGHLIELFLFFLLFIGINLLGVIAFGIGLLVSMPVSTIAFTYMYRHIEKQ